MKTEEHFAYKGVPRGIKESLALCERELEERIHSVRSVIGAPTNVRSLEVAGDPCVRAGDIRKWKQAVSDAVQARIRRRNLSAEQDRARRRLDSLFMGGSERRESCKVGRSRTAKLRLCFGCGSRGHLIKQCKDEKKDNDFRGRIL